jgi:hypothetical protein
MRDPIAGRSTARLSRKGLRSSTSPVGVASWISVTPESRELIELRNKLWRERGWSSSESESESESAKLTAWRARACEISESLEAIE